MLLRPRSCETPPIPTPAFPIAFGRIDEGYHFSAAASYRRAISPFRTGSRAPDRREYEGTRSGRRHILALHSRVLRYINQEVNDLYGSNTNPPLVLYNLNQNEIHALQLSGRWDQITDILSEAAMKLRAAGAQAVMFCA